MGIPPLFGHITAATHNHRNWLAWSGLAVCVTLLGLWRQFGGEVSPAHLMAPEFALETSFPTKTGEASLQLREVARYDIPMPADAPAAHASFLLAVDSPAAAVKTPTALQAFWFAGSRESGEDVHIATSMWQDQAWTAPTVAVDRHRVFGQLGWWHPGHAIRRLGNPVAWQDTQGRTHLYVVATTWLGGWAASRILHLRRDPPDQAFQPLGFLPLSPLFNISHLVRGAPIALTDGGVLLPAYFEIGIKYPVAIRLDREGNLSPSRRAVIRLGGNLATLQPTVAVHSGQKAIAYLRDNSDDKKLRFVQTLDAGAHWHDVPSSQASLSENGALAAQTPQGADWVINPDASAAAVRLGEQTLLIHNPQTSGRHRLVIESSRDGLRRWKRLATLEYEPEKLDGVLFNEYSYPSAVRIGDQLHVSYTYQKRFIRHVVLALENAP